MQRYIVHRFLQGIVALLVISIIVFTLSRLTGNPLDLLIPEDAPAALRERMAANLGLDKPLPVQYFNFIRNMAQGDFGESIVYRESCLFLFLQRLPNSLSLIIPSFILAFLVGIPLGVLAAINRGKLFGYVCEAVAVIGIAVPHFWLALVLMMTFSSLLGILPAARMGGPDHYVLPVASMSLYLLAGIMRLIRSAMLDALGSEYVKLARIKGLSEFKVIIGHCLRNSLIPAVSFSGMYFARLIAGTIVIEMIFAWPGTGRLLYQGIMNRDYPLIQSVIILKAALILSVTLVVDIAYAYLDPRIRY
ncbi:ABC transporter permease [Chloroflexota bacterium]